MDELRAYELNTVTDGINYVSYLAIRVLKHIVENDCAEFPLVRQGLLFHTYVDDICVCADSEVEVVDLQSELVRVLFQAGLELKKWSSNTQEVSENVSAEDLAYGNLVFGDGNGYFVKVLGLHWNTTDDLFSYEFNSRHLVLTKRVMWSLTARIFDPIGLLSPIVFMAKHLMQRVW